MGNSQVCNDNFLLLFLQPQYTQNITIFSQILMSGNFKTMTRKGYNRENTKKLYRMTTKTGPILFYIHSWNSSFWKVEHGTHSLLIHNIEKSSWWTNIYFGKGPSRIIIIYVCDNSYHNFVKFLPSPYDIASSFCAKEMHAKAVKFFINMTFC